MLDRQRPLLLLLAFLLLPAVGLLGLTLDAATPTRPIADAPAPRALALASGDVGPRTGEHHLVIDETFVGPLHARTEAQNCLLVTTNGKARVAGGTLTIERKDPVDVPEEVEVERPLQLLIGAPATPTATTTGALPFTTSVPEFDLWRGIDARFLVRLPEEGPRVAVREALTMRVTFLTEGDPLAFRVGGCS